MKKNVWCTLALLFLSALCVTGCDWFTAVDDGKIPQGVIFYTGCPVAFYFIDEDGNDLVDARQESSYPLVFRFIADEDDRVQALMPVQTISQTEHGVTTDFYVYNAGSNWLWEDTEENLHAFQSYMWGKTQNTECTMLIYANKNAAPDSLQVQYKYRTSKDDPSLEGSWGVDITSLRYQGVEVFIGNEKRKVFIEKPSLGGKTIVHVGAI